MGLCSVASRFSQPATTRVHFLLKKPFFASEEGRRPALASRSLSSEHWRYLELIGDGLKSIQKRMAA